MRQQERNKQLLEESQQTLMQQTAAATTGDKELVDLPGCVITDMDRMVDGDGVDGVVTMLHTHQNDDRTHWMGGIADDADWQARFNSLAVLDNQQYNHPPGRVGHTFLDEFSSIIEGAEDRECGLCHGCFAAHQLGEKS